MNNRQILERAIQKAIDNGWDVGDALTVKNTINNTSGTIYDSKFESGIIFSHDFAKALWPTPEGYEFVKLPGSLHHGSHVEKANPKNKIFGLPRYMQHLQQMVIADDPIKYLGDNL